MSIPKILWDDYTWHERDYTMREFMGNYRNHLPLIITVTEGFCGMQNMHTYASDELFRIHTYVGQKRVLLRNINNGVVISTPLNYEHKFHIIHKDGTREDADYLKNIYHKLKFPDVTKHLAFEDNQSISFLVGDDGEDSMEFGKLEIMDEYEQKYLVANTIYDGGLYPTAVVIPSYVSIKVKYAIGVLPEKGGHKAFSAHVSNLDQSASKLVYVNLTTNNELMLFNPADCSSDSDYEYVTPYDYVKFTPGPIPAACVHKVEEKPDNKPKVPDRLKDTKRSIKPPIKPPESHNKVRVSVSPLSTKQTNTKKPRVPRADKNINNNKVKTPPSAVAIQQEDQHDSYTKEDDEDSYGTLKDVPKTLDGISVRQVASCLRLLKIGMYVDVFQNEDVDGEMLKALTQEMMENTFGMTPFHALKLSKFTNGYRPHVD